MAPERVVVLGVHGGDVPAGTRPLLDAARLVAGGRDVLATVALPAGAEQVVLGADLAATLPRLDGDGVVVLASGDPGFFGIVRRLAKELGHDRLDVHPAPSSVAVAFARLGLPWDDAHVVSAHARDPHAAIAVALRHPKVVILTGPDTPPSLFADALRGSGRTLTVAERLGTPGQRVTSGTPEELAGRRFAEPNVVIVLADAVPDRATVWPPRTPARWGLPESAFEHRAGMITKAEVRAVAVARLGPGAGDLVWDVGCGSGSVAVECARLGAAVVALDHDAEAVALTKRNAATHGVPVRALHGAAPEVLGALPDPDAAFVGGGGAALEAIVDVAAARTRRVVVVTLALVDRVAPTLARLEAAGLVTDAVQLQASRLRPLAGGHRLAAENPVFVLVGERP